MPGIQSWAVPKPQKYAKLLLSGPFLRFPAPQKYVKERPFGLCLELLGHCFAYFWCPGTRQHAVQVTDLATQRDTHSMKQSAARVRDQHQYPQGSKYPNMRVLARVPCKGVGSWFEGVSSEVALEKLEGSPPQPVPREGTQKSPRWVKRQDLSTSTYVSYIIEVK